MRNGCLRLQSALLFPRTPLSKQKQLLLHSFASSTKATYGTGLLKFHIYCDTSQIPEIHRTPCITALLAGFITILSGQHSKTTIANFIAAVKAWNLVNSLPHDIDNATIHKLLRGPGRIQPLPLHRQQPITTHMIQRILVNLDISKHEQAGGDGCLTTVLWTCARLGEFTTPTIKAFDPRIHVTVNSISFQQDRYSNKVTVFRVPRTKCSESGEPLFWAPQLGSLDP